MSNYTKEWQDSHYVCPVSKQPLIPKTNGLFCPQEGVEYPVKNGIVDFIKEVQNPRPCLGTLGGWMVVAALSCAVQFKRNFYPIM